MAAVSAVRIGRRTLDALPSTARALSFRHPHPGRWTNIRILPIIRYMFESKLEEALGDPSALLRLAADTVAAERQAGCRKLVIAAAWAGCHGAPAELELADDAAIEAQSALVDRFVRIGPTGTPLVAECSPAELGKALQTGPAAAKSLMRVALIVRYRLPRLWERVKAGEVWLWKVRQIAERSAHLGALTSWCLDMQITRWVEQVAWARFLDIFDAALLRVDEDTYRRRAEEAAGQRDVRSFRGEQGLRTLVARMEAGDDAAFMALVNRVAQCLAEEGDEDPVGIRRSKAMGIIAHQAKLRDILARHAADPDDPRHPEERVAAHLDDPTDPWAEDDVPQAGWQTAGHGTITSPDSMISTTSRTAGTPNPSLHQKNRCQRVVPRLTVRSHRSMRTIGPGSTSSVILSRLRRTDARKRPWRRPGWMLRLHPRPSAPPSPALARPLVMSVARAGHVGRRMTYGPSPRLVSPHVRPRPSFTSMSPIRR